MIVGAITGGERFLDPGNAVTIVRYGSILGVISIGMTFVITAGGIDLSVGSLMGLTTRGRSLSWVQAAATETSWVLMVVVALAVGGLAGFINGIVIAYGKVVPSSRPSPCWWPLAAWPRSSPTSPPRW